jgi:hypothetical protein
MVTSTTSRKKTDPNKAGPSWTPPPPPAEGLDASAVANGADGQTEAYNYVVTAHRPSAVTESLVATFTGPNDINLIISKVLRIEIHRLLPDGLQGVADVPIYGRIVNIRVRPPALSIATHWSTRTTHLHGAVEHSLVSARAVNIFVRDLFDVYLCVCVCVCWGQNVPTIASEGCLSSVTPSLMQQKASGRSHQLSPLSSSHEAHAGDCPNFIGGRHSMQGRQRFHSHLSRGIEMTLHVRGHHNSPGIPWSHG